MRITRHNIRVLILMLLLATTAAADVPYQAWWTTANQHFQVKNYDSAAVYYEKLAARQPENPELFYNLGNTYYRLNRIGQAVLNYERALLLQPNYKQAQENLELTRSRIANRIQQAPDIFFVKWWHSLTATNMSFTWAIVSLLLFLFLLSTVLLRQWQKNPSWLQTPAMVLLLICFVITSTLAYFSAYRHVSRHAAVVMQQDTPLHEGLQNKKIQLLLPEGTVIQVREERGEWLQVKLPDGRSGWLQKQAIQTI